MKRSISRLCIAAIGAVAGFAVLAGDVAEAAELVVYTAANPKRHKVTMAAFQKAFPNIKVSSVNGSTGPMARRAIAEKDNPQADVIYAINTFYL